MTRGLQTKAIGAKFPAPKMTLDIQRNGIRQNDTQHYNYKCEAHHNGTRYCYTVSFMFSVGPNPVKIFLASFTTMH